MNKIKAILIDDEANALEVMEWLIKTYCPMVDIVGQFQDAEECLKVLTQLNPDVVFLDVEMPRLNGFEFIEKVTNRNFDVVFTTAYDKFAVRAFKYAALNYLLKPVDPDELMQTIDRLTAGRKNIDQGQLELLFHNMLNKDSQPEKVALSTTDGVIFVYTKEIIYCKAESNYTSIALQSGKKILVAKTLKEIDETLSGKDFFRVHKSYLVNVHHINKFVKGEGGYIVMPDGTQITVARERKDDFMQLFTKI